MPYLLFSAFGNENRQKLHKESDGRFRNQQVGFSAWMYLKKVLHITSLLFLLVDVL